MGPGWRDTVCPAVSTDTRTLGAGELFWALEGETYDAHDFVPEVLRGGAAGAVVRRGLGLAEAFADKPVIEVPDTLRALGDLAACVRHSADIPVFALTGSVGKTTIREMLAALLGGRYRLLKCEKNFNNLIGLPLTLLRLTRGHTAAVLELGTNMKGEMERLVAMARPRVALIANVLPVHVELLGGVESIAREKGWIYRCLDPDGWAVVNADDPLVCAEADQSPARRRVTFGMGAGAEVRAQGVRDNATDALAFDLVTPEGVYPVRLPTSGAHQVMNALAAAAMARADGLPGEEIAERLSLFRPFARRFNHLVLPNGIHLIDDTYNSNPISAKAALETVTRMKGGARAIVALGDMLELGEGAAEAHRELGRRAAGLGFAALVSFGELARLAAESAAEAGMPAPHAFARTEVDEVIETLDTLARPGDWVLVKGSRGMAMERVVDALKRRWGA